MESGMPPASLINPLGIAYRLWGDSLETAQSEYSDGQYHLEVTENDIVAHDEWHPHGIAIEGWLDELAKATKLQVSSSSIAEVASEVRPVPRMAEFIGMSPYELGRLDPEPGDERLEALYSFFGFPQNNEGVN